MEAYRDTEQDAPDALHEAGSLSPDGPDELEATPEVEVELRPARRLRGSGSWHRSSCSPRWDR